MSNEKYCFTKNQSSRIDLILSNKPSSFQLSHATESGLSDCHKLIGTCMKATISRSKSKVINYSNYKKFDVRIFLSDIQQKHFECNSSDVSRTYSRKIMMLFRCLILGFASLFVYKAKTV